MLKPNNLKYSKCQKGRLSETIKLDRLCYGDFALMANQPARINSAQLTAAILAIKRLLKKDGVPLLRLFTHTPVTQKPSEVRMGKGKGPVSHYITKVQTGTIILEIRPSSPDGAKTPASAALAISALKVAQSKLPLDTSILRAF
jgi:large subunit ribosomal protein L16